MNVYRGDAAIPNLVTGTTGMSVFGYVPLSPNTATCTYTFTGTVTSNADTEAIAWDDSNLYFTIDTTSTPDITKNSGAYVLTVTPIAPDTSSEMAPFVVTFNILEPCDVP